MKKAMLNLKNGRSLSRGAQKSIIGGAAKALVCCERNDQGKCTLWIGPGQHCP
jgi:hypothetical protein